MDARTCDECGKVGHPPYLGWLRTTENTDFEMFGERSIEWDSCSTKCLAATCARELEKAAARA